MGKCRFRPSIHLNHDCYYNLAWPPGTQTKDVPSACSLLQAHTIDRGTADAIDFGKMVGRLAIGQALAGLGTLHVVEPELGAHLHAVLAGDRAAFVGALDDAQALVLGHCGDECHEAAAYGACQIDVSAVEHANGGPGVDDLFQDLQAVPHRPGGPVPFSDHELIAGSEAVESLPELRPAGEALA